MNTNRPFSLACPIPIEEYPVVTLAHGGGGKLMNDLIERMFRTGFGSSDPTTPHDGAVLNLPGRRVAFTTDSYVVRPLFFPGGDIGSLAVHGTVNDLAMCGARPLWLSAGFIIEEGFSMADLWRVVVSMKQAAEESGVSIVTGDTKVVDRGKGDGLYINTSGVGEILTDPPLFPTNIREGDCILLSGDLGRHGIAIMAVREGLSFESEIRSDSADLSGVAVDLVESGLEVHCMRDLTRGGLVSCLNELSYASGFSMKVRESAIPISEEVRGACEILGLDPLAVANEGRFVVFVPPEATEKALQRMKHHPLCAEACRIGTVESGGSRLVSIETEFGVSRILPMPSGEQLPRIC